MACDPPPNSSAAIGGTVSETVRPCSFTTRTGSQRGDEPQLVAGDQRHPVHLVPPRSVGPQHAPVGQPGGPGRRAVDASQHLLAPAVRRTVGAPAALHHSSPRQTNGRMSSNPRTRSNAGAGRSSGGRISTRRGDPQIRIQPQQEIAGGDRRAVCGAVFAVVGQRVIHAALHHDELIAAAQRSRDWSPATPPAA